MDELLPCPLCGTKAQITVLNHHSSSTVNISCGTDEYDRDTCGLVLFGGNEDSEESMLAKWNTRKPEPCTN